MQSMAEGGGLRLMLYDRTCKGRFPMPGLTSAWRVGGALYSSLRRIDDWYGAATWAEGLEWLVERARTQPIAELQFWGHGEWGCAFIEEEKLEISALEPRHWLHRRLVALRSRFIPGGEALRWFRTCETIGTKIGHDFTRAWTRFFDCRVAGHTHAINFLQSGLHVLAPGEEPTWPVTEGIEPGRPRAKDSSVFAPNTITCLHGALPRELT